MGPAIPQAALPPPPGARPRTTRLLSLASGCVTLAGGQVAGHDHQGKETAIVRRGATAVGLDRDRVVVATDGGITVHSMTGERTGSHAGGHRCSHAREPVR